MTESPETPGPSESPESAGTSESPAPTHVMAAIDELRETRWPSVIGGISLAYAIGGLLCQVMAGAMTFLGEWLMQLGGMDLTIPLPIKLAQFSMVVVTTAVGIMMLVGAVKLLRRRRGGVSLLRKWAFLRVLLLFIGIVIAVLTAGPQTQIQRAALEIQNQRLRDAGRGDLIQEATDEELWQKYLRNTLLASGAFLIYPVFLGVYLSRRKIEEEITAWD
ncbi:MAG: hypothetical protein ACYTGG_04625 [Planctomycetota bacterium]|jgi:hypothetical protein